MKRKDADEFFRRLAKERPDPRSELVFINPYTLLVAVVLSAQLDRDLTNPPRELEYEFGHLPRGPLVRHHVGKVAHPYRQVKMQRNDPVRSPGRLGELRRQQG